MAWLLKNIFLILIIFEEQLSYKSTEFESLWEIEKHTINFAQNETRVMIS